MACEANIASAFEQLGDKKKAIVLYKKIIEKYGAKGIQKFMGFVPNFKDDLNQVYNSIQIRFKLNSSKSSLLIIQSYDVSKISEDLKKRLIKMNVLFESESKTFDSCKYVNENNWICKSHNGFGSGYEMKNGDLFRDGDKLNKQYSIKF